ncbi:MAG: Cobalamin synthase, partial [uncultured Rubellimicrobium sp.]
GALGRGAGFGCDLGRVVSGRGGGGRTGGAGPRHRGAARGRARGQRGRSLGRRDTRTAAGNHEGQPHRQLRRAGADPVGADPLDGPDGAVGGRVGVVSPHRRGGDQPLADGGASLGAAPRTGRGAVAARGPPARSDASAGRSRGADGGADCRGLGGRGGGPCSAGGHGRLGADRAGAPGGPDRRHLRRRPATVGDGGPARLRGL